MPAPRGSPAGPNQCYGRQVVWNPSGTVHYNECKPAFWLCGQGCGTPTKGHNTQGGCGSDCYQWYSTGCDCTRMPSSGGDDNTLSLSE